MYEIFPKKINEEKVEIEFKMLVRAFLDVAREEIAKEQRLLKSASSAPRPTN